MNKIFIIILLSIALLGCKPNSTKQLLSKQGYNHIKIHGYGWLSCSDSDFFKTKFTATSIVNKKVSGIVCCGLLFKACTIRFY